MGMYTGLRAKLILKDEFVPVIARLRELAEQEGESWDPWEQVAAEFPQYRFLMGWAGVGRCHFIPFGALSYMPWDQDDPDWQHTLKNGVWTFQCSLKNYEGEIDYFVELVLRRITRQVIELYSLYEENDEPEHINL